MRIEVVVRCAKRDRRIDLKKRLPVGIRLFDEPQTHLANPIFGAPVRGRELGGFEQLSPRPYLRVAGFGVSGVVSRQLERERRVAGRATVVPQSVA
jgi:hypothetical protein